MARLPVSVAAIRKLLKEIEASGDGDHVLAVGGAHELAPVLRQQFLRGRPAPGAVRFGGPEGAAVYVHVLAGVVTEDDEASLREARRARVPVVAVARGPARQAGAIPYVLATDVVRMAAGGNFPLEAIAETIAARLGEHGAPLAGRVPLLRTAVCRQLVSSFSRRNGVLAAAVWLPGADLPIPAVNELRLVARLAQVYGLDPRHWVPELAATVAAALALRALAPELLDSAPRAGWALNGALAYAGTRALGEAASKRFALAATQPQAAASRAAP